MNKLSKESQQKSAGQIAYELDLQRRPTFHDGAPRPSWDELGREYSPQTRDVIRNSWNTTPITESTGEAFSAHARLKRP